MGRSPASPRRARAEPLATPRSVRYEAATMSGGHDAPSNDLGEVHPHRPLPTIVDEAVDTPLWVPAAGLALFVLLALFVVFRSVSAAPAPGASDPHESADAPADPSLAE